MNSLINFRLSLVLLSSVMIFLLSCGKDKDTADQVNKSNKTEIKSWKFGNEVAKINGTDITVTLAYGTDITALKADIELPKGASISPDPANSMGIDYTSSVNFTVTAEDKKTTKSYKVKVSVIQSNEADIKSWKFGNKMATINGTDITVTLAYGTDITKLKADVKLSPGASISPDPANSNGIDYTPNSVNFTVTADDGTTKDYKVAVSVEDAIISWTAGWRDNDAYNANINQRSGKINIDVNSADFDTRVNLSGGVTINPDPNSVTDWTDEVTFTTKKGSETKTYTVKVTVDGKDIIKLYDGNIIKVKDEIENYGNTRSYNYIDVSSVTNMESLFGDMCDFNGDISKWDVSNVVNMKYMFKLNISCSGKKSKFNKDIGDWDVSNVTDMREMFNSAIAFNQDIGGWNVSNVTNMKGMFWEAKAFNQNIGSWTVSNVETMDKMFNSAIAFNQDIGGWNVSNVTNMEGMFGGAEVFNQNIGSWTVSKVDKMEYMFFNAKAFNQNISSWDTSGVVNMESMFSGAEAFNQSISSWNVDNVIKCSRFSLGATAFQDVNKPPFKISCN